MESKNIKILAIDDNQDNLISLKALIHEAFPNATILTALNGIKGIELAISENPDVVLLDIVMPDMDGFEVCKKMKADKMLCDIPVVFVTAIKGDKEQRILALESGAEAFLAKPIDETELTAQIRAMLKIKKANTDKRSENERLTALVFERTLQLEKELEERKQVLESLKESEERFKYIFEAANVGKSITLPSGEVNANRAFCNMLGYTIEELKNKKWQDLTPSEDLEFISKIINSLIQGEKNDARFNKRYIHKNGSYIWSDISVSLRRDQQGQPLHFITTVIDITQQKKAEEQLIKLSRAVEQSPASIFLTDTAGNIDYANPKAIETSGFELKEIIGKNFNVFSLGEKPNGGYLGLWETISSGNEWRGEFHNKKKNGELYWESASVSPITNNKGDITHYLAIKEDITEHKQILDDLIIAKEKAEESNRLKTSFLQNMSHEIRTPMNGILGFTGLLKNPTLSGEKRDEFIDIVEFNGQRLLTTINDIIEISKIEAGTVETNLKAESIEDIMQSHFNFFNPEIEKMGLNLKITYHNGINQDQIIVDRYKVDSIFINLINNAKKFTKQGGIEIGCYRDGNFLVFYVKDSGIGIPNDKHEAIFERFVQADQAITSGYEGSGLGLSISKAYVEMLGGKIWLDSTLNSGSTFYFSMPYIAMNDSLRAISRQTDETTYQIDSSIQILIAEDDEVSYLFLDTLLSEYGIESIHAVDGAEAIQKLNKNGKISLILMDLKMPGMDGFEATRQIRQFNKTIPIIAQTAYALSGDKEKAIEAGCTDYITKPINKNEFINLIHRYAKRV